jgi:hypothetical protein
MLKYRNVIDSLTGGGLSNWGFSQWLTTTHLKKLSCYKILHAASDLELKEKLHNNGLHNSSLPEISSVIKPREMRWMIHRGNLEEMHRYCLSKDL